MIDERPNKCFHKHFSAIFLRTWLNTRYLSNNVCS